MTSTNPAPRRGRPGHSTDQVLAAAVRVFNKHGYAATSMGMLAEELGVTKSALYHHVDSKESMLAAALGVALDGLEQVFADPRAREGEVSARLEYVVRATVTTLIERQPYVTLLLRLRGNTATGQEALDRRRAFDDEVAVLMTEADRVGVLRPGLDPEVAARAVFGAINSLVDWYDPAGRLDPAAMADQFATVLLDGLRH